MFEGGASGAARACVAKACAWTCVVGMRMDTYTYVYVIYLVERRMKWRKMEQLTKRRNWTSAGKSSGGARACVCVGETRARAMVFGDESITWPRMVAHAHACVSKGVRGQVHSRP